ncbi:D-aminoacyl-tRNA deacylase [Gynuella sunshinyii]|uniref:D-aminoacyl-tRNA deacylase n=1 Tax=Gynuella sunshinyii YC6258 TaxID=1445510 RepID=A0A0C5W552_9GAMM|nr:D-aminoacyl-tRNA deacylase [Gynuella sunshinyii]AJQ97724.1 D-Tyr-tRNAtyr deacylase [Gynuella sunshinyii YC6258]
MQVLIQRVQHASVVVDNQTIGSIGQGLLALVGIEKNDTAASVEKMVNKLLAYRVFNDELGKMNLSLRDIQGELLLVSQFTLAADTRKGLRPGFSTAAEPQKGRELFELLLQKASEYWPERIATGQFGADMKVSLLNDGPVTFLLTA